MEIKHADILSVREILNSVGFNFYCNFEIVLEVMEREIRDNHYLVVDIIQGEIVFIQNPNNELLDKRFSFDEDRYSEFVFVAKDDKYIYWLEDDIDVEYATHAWTVCCISNNFNEYIKKGEIKFYKD